MKVTPFVLLSGIAGSLAMVNVQAAQMAHAAHAATAATAAVAATATESGIAYPPMPAVPREFRAAYVSTLGNRDWPSRPGMTEEQQKAEVIANLDLLETLNFNAVILQVRANCDAIYLSGLEPCSAGMTGVLGKCPDYDPLAFWIQEAHKRGMEIHAWLSGFRVHHTVDGVMPTEHSLVHSKEHRHFIHRLKNDMWWMDPGHPSAKLHLNAVVRDLVTRYEIDGLQLDATFYPHPEFHGEKNQFPDQATYDAYKAEGGKLDRNDWRRQNIDDVIVQTSYTVSGLAPRVKFGVAPLAIWKTEHPAGTGTHYTSFDWYFADAKRWLEQGWVDYMAPQLDWPIDMARKSFSKLLTWWQEQNVKGRNVYAGLNPSEIEPSNGIHNRPVEIWKQITASREILPARHRGQVHSTLGGIKEMGMQVYLQNFSYQTPTLAPEMPWKDAKALPAPQVTVTVQDSGVVRLAWTAAPEAESFLSAPQDSEGALEHLSVSDESVPSLVLKWQLCVLRETPQAGLQWTVETLPRHVAGTTLPIRDNEKGTTVVAVTVRALDGLQQLSAYEVQPINKTEAETLRM